MKNPDIDRLVAEKVMGWKEKRLSNISSEWVDENGELQVFNFKPSRQIYDAWKLVEKFKSKGYRFGIIINGNQVYRSWFSKEDSYGEVTAATAPMAICLAALKLLELKVEKE